MRSCLFPTEHGLTSNNKSGHKPVVLYVTVLKKCSADSHSIKTMNISYENLPKITIGHFISEEALSQYTSNL